MEKNYKLKYEKLVDKIEAIQNRRLQLDQYKKYVIKLNGKYVKECDFCSKKIELVDIPEQLQLFDSVEVYIFYENHLLNEVEIVEYAGLIQEKYDKTYESKRVIELESDSLQCGITSFHLFKDFYPNSKQQQVILYNEEYFFELTEYIPDLEEKGYDLSKVLCVRDCGKNKLIYPYLLGILIAKNKVGVCNNGVVDLPLHELKF